MTVRQVLNVPDNLRAHPDCFPRRRQVRRRRAPAAQVQEELAWATARLQELAAQGIAASLVVKGRQVVVVYREVR